jgi:hypothetical protein
MLGLRFQQASLLVPLHRNAPVGKRALPIRFQGASRIKRPGKKTTEEMQKQYKEAEKQKSLSRSIVDMGKRSQYPVCRCKREPRSKSVILSSRTESAGSLKGFCWIYQSGL